MIRTDKLVSENIKWVGQINEILIDTFGEKTPGKWLKDIKRSFEQNRISIAAIDDKNNAVGWIGGISQYSGNVWEIHPLVTKREMRGKGIGTLLVKSLEIQVGELGGNTVWLGSDDEDNSTSLSGIDLYEDLFENIRNIKNLKNHPYEFYKKLGYTIVGVMPDANGYGKPDIYMAKRIKIPAHVNRCCKENSI